MKTVVLITSTISLNNTVKYARHVKDANQRLDDYKKCLFHLGKSSVGITDIVYCDNSGYTTAGELMLALGGAKLVNYLKDNGINIHFVALPKQEYINKGVGEAELVKAGIKFIENLGDPDTYIIKLTGRVKVVNFDVTKLDRNKIHIPHNWKTSNHSKRFKYLTWTFSFPLNVGHLIEENLNVPNDENQYVDFELALVKCFKLSGFQPVDYPWFEIVDSIQASNGKPYMMNPDLKPTENE